jgi:hypothetical protein
MTEANPFELPWEKDDNDNDVEDEAKELKQPALKPTPKIPVPDFNKEAISKQSTVDVLAKQWQTAETKLTEVIARSSEDDPKAVLDAMVELASAAYKHDVADAEAKFLLVPDESLPGMVQEHRMAYERAQVQLKTIEQEYGNTSATYEKAVQDLTALGAQRREIEYEIARRQDTEALDEGHQRTAMAAAERAWREGVQERIAELSRDPEVDPEVIADARRLAGLPWSQVPERMKLYEAALADAQEATHQRNISKYVQAIAVRHAIDEQIAELYNQTAADADHRLAVMAEARAEQERRAAVDAAIEQERRKYEDTAFGRALAAAQSGQTFFPRV